MLLIGMPSNYLEELLAIINLTASAPEQNRFA